MTRHLLPEEFDLVVDADAGIDAGFGVGPLRAHVRTCAACAAELDAARLVAAELDAIPRLAPSPRFADAVMQQVQVFEPWHVAAGDWARGLVPASRALRAAAAGGLLAGTAVLTVVLAWLAARADALAFTGEAAVTRFRGAFWTAAGDLAAAVFGDAVRTADGALVAGAGAVFVATAVLAALALRAAAASGREAAAQPVARD
jgi:hypothetical protein